MKVIRRVFDDMEMTFLERSKLQYLSIAQFQGKLSTIGTSRAHDCEWILFYFFFNHIISIYYREEVQEYLVIMNEITIRLCTLSHHPRAQQRLSHQAFLPTSRSSAHLPFLISRLLLRACQTPGPVSGTGRTVVEMHRHIPSLLRASCI